MSLTLATLEKLLSAEGQAALAEAGNVDQSNRLAAIQKVRKQFDAELAAAAVETALLRRKAAVKFRMADRMYFASEALEMASGERIADYRANRFSGFAEVGDWCCGLGGDAIGFARAGRAVRAVERDPVLARMAELNVSVNGLSAQATVILGDVLDPSIEVPLAVFVDPARRRDGARHLSVAQYEPKIDAILLRLPAGHPVAFKLAPGLNPDELESYGGEVEFVSVDGELKECILWLGTLTTARSRGTSIVGDRVRTMSTDRRIDPLEPGPIGAILYDPDPAIVRAKLVPLLGATMGATGIDWTVQMLTSDEAIETPFATAYRIDVVLPLDERAIKKELSRRGIGRVTPINRGSLGDPAALAKAWNGSGPGHRVAILTRECGRQVAAIGERLTTSIRSTSP